MPVLLVLPLLPAPSPWAPLWAWTSAHGLENSTENLLGNQKKLDGMIHGDSPTIWHQVTILLEMSCSQLPTKK